MGKKFMGLDGTGHFWDRAKAWILEQVTSAGIDKQSVIDAVYPVGSLYWSSKDTDPSTLFGGTWVQIKDKFVLACGDTYTSSGATGGASSVTLSVSNMPSHSHSFTPSGTISKTGGHQHGPGSTLYNVYQPNGGSNNRNEPSYLSYFNTNKNWYDWGNVNRNSQVRKENNTSQIGTSSVTPALTGYAGYHDHTFTGRGGTTSPEGSGTSFSILPPYVVKYCWERTA